ncbi:hypothetical protein [Thalassospira sp. CH_XMU1420-2]|uniref:hypothetical protein n=1 Tax=Thalassospira sp. CH_XMU1420-2 TaxID=3107769 RepID=UPI003009D466
MIAPNADGINFYEISEKSQFHVMRFRCGCSAVSPQRRVGMVSKASLMAHRCRGAVSGGAFGMFFPAHRFQSIVSGAPFPEHRVRSIVFWYRLLGVVFKGIVFEAVWGARHRPICLRRATGWSALTIFY